jgi:hypothetical protein
MPCRGHQLAALRHAPHDDDQVPWNKEPVCEELQAEARALRHRAEQFFALGEWTSRPAQLRVPEDDD